jgi:anti-sigma factor RsiW
MTHAELSELLGAYALDAVSPEEATEIEEHLAECPRCRAELTAHREVAGVLGNFGGTAPAGLWDRIADELAIGSAGSLPAEPPSAPETPALGPSLTSVGPRTSSGAEADAPVDAGGAEAGAGAGAGLGEEAEDDDEDDVQAMSGEGSALAPPAAVIPIESGRSARHLRSVGTTGPGSPPRDRRRNVLFAAVAAVAAALALTVGLLGSQVAHLNNQVSALSQAIVAGGTRGQVMAAELDPSHRTVNLTSTGASWSAQVVTLPNGQAWLVPGRMPALPSSQTFQAWALVGSKYVSLGVLGRAPGYVALQLQPGMSRVLVNTEPLGGSPQPTTSPIISGALPATV